MSFSHPPFSPSSSPESTLFILSPCLTRTSIFSSQSLLCLFFVFARGDEADEASCCFNLSFIFLPYLPPRHSKVGRYSVGNQDLEARVAIGPGASGHCIVRILLQKWLWPQSWPWHVVCSKEFLSGSLPYSLLSPNFYNEIYNIIPNRSSVHFSFFPFSEVPCLFIWAWPNGAWPLVSFFFFSLIIF